MKSQTSLSVLNTGQSLIIATAVTLILWRATEGVIAGTMTLGDLVLVNTFMIQLYIPLNFLGVIYREIKQSLADMERLFGAAGPEPRSGRRQGRAAAGARTARASRSRNVEFSYEAKRQILFDVDFTIPAGTTTAVVGHSGSGKSTLSRLLFRFYDVNSGSITIDGQDLRDVTQESLRARDRHRAAGYGAVQRHHRIQHRLRQAGRDARTTSWRRRARRRSTTSSKACRTGTRRWSASAG